MVDGEDGHRLTSAGEYVIGAIVAQQIDQRPQFGTFDVDGSCPRCGGRLRATFEDLVEIRCVD